MSARAAPPWRAITAIAVLFASALVSLMFWPHLVAVWQAGTFYDTDDAMRLVEVRALRAGQAWFDVSATRLDPPLGSSMHWSRLVDAPLALLIDGFAIFVDQARAEILARLVFPFALLLGLFTGVARLADTLYGAKARLPAIGATLLCGAAVVQFQPGRIDHHTPEIVLLVFMVEAALAALDPAKARRAALAGVLVAVALAISLEDLPFILGLCGMLVALWIWRGAALAPTLGAFGLGLAAALVPFFLVTVGPMHWFDPVCDAFGAAHLGAGLIGGLGCVVLARGALATRMLRLAAAAGVAACVLAFVAFAYPSCLHDPFANVDPLVRAVWLSNVTESLSLPRFFQHDRVAALLVALPVALGLCGCLVGALAATGARRMRFLLLSALAATGLAMGFWQIRVLTSVTPLAVCGALPLAIAAHDWCDRCGRDLMAVLALCLVFPFTSLAWGMVLPEAPDAPVKPPNTCLAAASFGTLASLPPGRALAPIDAGSHLLVHTPLDVFSAPYHRNNDGNRFALDAFMAAPARAVAMLAARGATYVLTCEGLGETAALAKRAPGGLAAALVAGRTPEGLTRLAVPNTPYAVYRLDPAKM